MTYVIYYKGVEGKVRSMPSSSEEQLEEDLSWLKGNGDEIVKVVALSSLQNERITI